MGVSVRWSDAPPRKALAAMASLAKRLRAWFSLEPEKRARTRRVVKEGLTRGGFFLMGLLLAWLWMMLIGRSMTNRCWLPGVLLQWRHRGAWTRQCRYYLQDHNYINENDEVINRRGCSQ